MRILIVLLFKEGTGLLLTKFIIFAIKPNRFHNVKILLHVNKESCHVGVQKALHPYARNQIIFHNGKQFVI